MRSEVLSSSEISAKVNPYGYTPTEWVGIFFLVLFSLSTLIHAVQAAYTRLWWLHITVCVAGILEILGWSARLWSSFSVYAKIPYLMQITTTIIAPTPLVAANFIILGQLIRRLGHCYSRLSAKWYTIVFCSCDMISLIVQALGGATASSEFNKGESADPGSHIMLGGIIFQMISITVYMTLGAEFLLRFLYDMPLSQAKRSMSQYGLNTDTKLMLVGLTFTSICIYIRSFYRLIELAGGWEGYVIRTERYFDVLDGGMVTLAMVTMNLFHPGFLLGPGPTWRDSEAQAKKIDECEMTQMTA